MEQRVLFASENYTELDHYLKVENIKSPLLVCGSSIRLLKVGKYFETVEARLGIRITYFSEFSPNPTYDSVVKGIRAFRENACDAVIAVGGGSAMDVAKCIKLWTTMKDDECYLEQAIIPNDIKLWAVPTTAGTGSEATRFAVIYYQGEKCSVSDYSCIPSTVLMDASTLDSLPEYQRKATMLDAFCHAIESFWSVNSTEESKGYAREAISMILENTDAYLANDAMGNEKMLYAANLAGKAINITQTTAGHAMCYKLTTLYRMAHGHAAALCVSVLWPYMIRNLDKCVDPRGKEYLERMFRELAECMGCSDVEEAAGKFVEILNGLGVHSPVRGKKEDYSILKTSVNLQRLKNNPICMDEKVIDDLYHQIVVIM